MPDDIITPIPDYIRQSLDRARKGIKLQPAAAMTPVLPPPQVNAEEPSLPQGVSQSFWAAANPFPGLKAAAEQYINRPAEAADLSRALAAGMRIRAGKELPGDRDLLQKGMQAHIGTPGQHPIVPPDTEPAVLSGVQAERGDIGGAGATLLGGYGQQVAIGMAVPPAVRGAVRGAKLVGRGAKFAGNVAKDTGAYALERIGETPLTYKGKKFTLENPRRIVARTAQGATTGATLGGGAGLLSGGYKPGLEGAIGGATVGGTAGATGVLVKGAARALRRRLAEARSTRTGPVWEGVVPEAAAESTAAADAARYRELLDKPFDAMTEAEWQEYTNLDKKFPTFDALHAAESAAPPPAGPRSTPKVEPIVTEPISERRVPTLEERIERAASPVEKAQAATKTPGQVYAETSGEDWAKLSPTDRQYMENIAQAQANVAAQEAERAARPAAPPQPPDTPPPETKSFAQETEERMREHLRDAEKETPPPPPPAEKETPPPTPPPPDEPETGGRMYSRTKTPDQEVTSQIHMHLNDAYGKRVSVTPNVEKIYGIKGKDSWDRLHIDDKSAMNAFVAKNNRLPTVADVDAGTFNPPRQPFKYGPGAATPKSATEDWPFASGGAVNVDESPSRRIAAELRNQGLTAEMATSITPEQWGDLSQAAGVSAVGQYSVEDTLRSMKKLEGGLQRGGPVRTAVPYTTTLTPQQESQFQAWVKQNKIPFDPGPQSDYDMRGFWKSMLAGQSARNPESQHFPDTYKTPYHQSFSNESIYATPDAPRWEGTLLVNKDGKVVFDDTLGGPPKARPFVGPLRKASGGTTRRFGLTPSQEDISTMLGEGVPTTRTPEDSPTPFFSPLEDEPHRRVPTVSTPLPPPYRAPKPSITREVLSTFGGVTEPVAGLEGTKGLVDPEGELDRVIRDYLRIGTGARGLIGAHTIGEGAGGLSDIGRSALDLYAPVGVAGAAAAGVKPLSMALGFGTGAGSAHLAGKALENTNLAPGTKAALTDVAALAGGIAGAGIPRAYEAIPEGAFGSERGSIPIGRGPADAEQPVGFLGPNLPPAVRGKLPEELALEQRQVLTPREFERLDEFKQKYPQFAEASRFMSPLELQKTIGLESNVEALNRLMTELPSARKIASVAKFGEPKRGWYRASAQAIMDVFGMHDSPRFTAVLAGMSPQTSVESNLMNALNVWKEWNAAGRPQDARAILEIMGRAVQGEKGEGSVLDAWKNNVIGALQSNDPLEYVLSGPKVDSFFRNLGGHVKALTNDAWIAALMGVKQEMFSGSRGAGNDPGIRPGYTAPSVIQRMAGHQIGFHPSEVQESAWSVVKPAYEMQEATGIRARDLFQRGLITPEAIRAGSPDFSTLMKTDPTIRSILEQSGYGEQVQRMPQYQWPEVSQSLSRSQQNDVLSVMERLEKLRGERAMESRAIQVPVESRKMPSRATLYETPEAVGGAGTGHLEEMAQEPYTKRQMFTSRIGSVWQNPLGQDVLHKAVGVPSLEARPATGSWVSQGTQQLENNPASALGVELPIRRGWNISDYDKARMDAVAAVRAGTTAQLGGAYSGFLPQTGGLSAFFARGKKVPPTNMQAAATHVIDNLRNETGALADIGAGVHYLNFSDQPLPEASLEFLSRQLSDMDTMTRLEKQKAAAVAAGVEPPTAASLAVPGKTIGNVIGMEKAWRQEPGGGHVARLMMEKINQLRPEHFEALDQAIRQPMADLINEYGSYIKSRKYPHRADLMNMLHVLRDHGLRGLEQGIDSGAFLPAAAGAVLLPVLHGLSQQEQD
jgi:hypothetical protein